MDVYLFILYECSYNIHWNRPKRHMLANKSIGKSEQKRSNHKKKWRNELQFRRIFIAQHMENKTWIQSETTIYTYRYINIRIYTLIYASEYCAIGAVVFFFFIRVYRSMLLDDRMYWKWFARSYVEWKRAQGKIQWQSNSEQKISGETHKKGQALHILNDLCEQSKGVKIKATTKTNEPNNKWKQRRRKWIVYFLKWMVIIHVCACRVTVWVLLLALPLLPPLLSRALYKVLWKSTHREIIYIYIDLRKAKRRSGSHWKKLMNTMHDGNTGDQVVRSFSPRNLFLLYNKWKQNTYFGMDMLSIRIFHSKTPPNTPTHHIKPTHFNRKTATAQTSIPC